MSENITQAITGETTPTYDIVGQIMAYEDGQLDGPAIQELYQYLLDNEMFGALQGSYGRQAERYLATGFIKRK